MPELIRCEIQKFKLLRQWAGVLAAILGCMLFLTVAIFNNAYTDYDNYTYDDLFKVIQLLLTTVFIVYSSAVLSTLVISEYNRKTIFVMFSYPIDRKKIITAKLLIVSMFTIISLILGYLACTILAVLLDHGFDVIDGSFTLLTLRTYLPVCITSIISCGAWALLPFSVGIQKKSVATTVASSLLVVLFRQIIITLNPLYGESPLQCAAILLFIALITSFSYKRRANDLDHI